MEEFIDRIQRDLAQASAHLLDRGLSAADQTSGAGGRVPRALGPVAESLLLATILLELVDAALEDVTHDDDMTRLRRTTSPFPRAGSTDFAPESLEQSGTLLAPSRWTTWSPYLRAPRDVVAWLLHVLDFLVGDLDQRTVVVRKSLDEALVFRSSNSAYFRAEAELARAQRDEVDSMLARLQARRRQVRDIRDGRVTASARLPSPLPRSRAWRRLLDLYGEASSPTRRATRMAEMLRAERSMTASGPFLYQRWCGWRLHEELMALGWRSRRDPIPMILLGGMVEYEREGRSFKLLVEPRLAASGEPVHGLRATRGEVTPDLVLMVPESDAPGAFVDAWVLDPTISQASELRKDKGKYLKTLQLVDPKRVAGTLTVAHPMRAWAMAPLDSAKCVLNYGDWRGLTGTIPMNPLSFSPEPLRAWLGDIAYLARTSDAATGAGG